MLPEGLIGNRSGLRDPFTSDFGEGDPLARGFSLKPYIDDAQRANISNGGDVRLFNELSGGLSSYINRDRAEGTLFARLTYRTPETGQGKSRLLLNELGKGSLDIVRNRVFLDVSTFANAVTRDEAQGVVIDPQNANGNLSQIYYAAVQPRVQREIGDVAIATARYQVAYTALQNRIGGSTSGGGSGIPGGGGSSNFGQSDLFLRPLSNTLSQTVEATIANQPRDGRFSAKFTSRLVGQSQERLQQHFRNRDFDLESTYALTRPVAIVGKIGYEDYRNSEEAIKTVIEYLKVGSLINNPLISYSLDGNPATNPALFISPFTGQPVNLGSGLQLAGSPTCFIRSRDQIAICSNRYSRRNSCRRRCPTAVAPIPIW